MYTRCWPGIRTRSGSCSGTSPSPSCIRTRSRPPRRPRRPGRRGSSGRCTSGCCSPRPVSTWTPCWTAPRTWSLDVGRFRDEVTGRAYAAKIERDVQEGVRDGVNATPKFYVDGERIDGKLPLEGLEDAIRAAVRAASAGLTSAGPDPDLGGLQRGLDHGGQVGADGIQVDRVLEPGGERGDRLVRVIPGPVEAPVHPVLNSPPHGVEQGGGGQGGGGHRHRAVDPEHLGGQQDQARVDPDQQAGDDRVGQGPGDDPVDVVQPVAQDGDADGQRDQRDGPGAYRVLEVGGRGARAHDLLSSTSATSAATIRAPA